MQRGREALLHMQRQSASAASASLTEVLAVLAKRRPVFHSEADFQLALAWAIQQGRPDCEI